MQPAGYVAHVHLSMHWSRPSAPALCAHIGAGHEHAHPSCTAGDLLEIVLVVTQAQADLPRYPLCAVASHAVLHCAVLSQDGFVVTTKGNMKFSEVDLSEGEWTEYDEKINESVGIYSLESKWELHKGK